MLKATSVLCKKVQSRSTKMGRPFAILKDRRRFFTEEFKTHTHESIFDSWNTTSPKSVLCFRRYNSKNLPRSSRWSSYNFPRRIWVSRMDSRFKVYIVQTPHKQLWPTRKWNLVSSRCWLHLARFSPARFPPFSTKVFFIFPSEWTLARCSLRQLFFSTDAPRQNCTHKFSLWNSSPPHLVDVILLK